MGVPTDIYQPNEPTFVWGYMVMSFIVFTIAVAVVRSLYRAHVGKTNIKKQIKKRFKQVFGDDNGAVDNSGLINDYQGPEESK